MYAKIAIESAPYHIDRPFTYRIPDSFEAKVGQRVSVPFGRGNRLTEGIILSLSNLPDTDASEIKSVQKILDEDALLNDAMLKVAAFMRERYFCTYYDAVKAVLPAGVWTKTRNIISLIDSQWRKRIDETDQQGEILQELERLGGEASEEDLVHLLGKDISSDLSTLKTRKVINIQRAIETHSSDKTETVYHLTVTNEQASEWIAAKRRRAPVQAEVLQMLLLTPFVSSKELKYYTGATSETLKKLEDAGLIYREIREVFRNSQKQVPAAEKDIELNEEQEYVYRKMLRDIEAQEKSISLLFGITGSGKTAVYIRLIQSTLQIGRSALLLVPEISLTPQLVSRLTSYFGSDIAVLHSALHIGERYDEWKRIKKNKAHVVVGTRSAVFAPIENLGLIIIDEEHEHSYKSENNPRYHAREIAIFRGNKQSAPVLLGSATPSIETMFLARTGVYNYYRLIKRYNGKEVPQAEIVDMRTELKEGNDSPLSRELQNRIENLNGHQAILFLNRRGAGKMLLCVDCGDVPDCPNCSAHLTYHRANGRLMCHYCGYSEIVTQECPVCGGHRKVIGYGTQTIQTEVQRLLPNQSILRMDADTVNAVDTHEVLLERFEKEKIPVMVGTQMVAKGLDFPNVTLVGIVDADSGLYMDSYRASETSFATITQVIGRSGRGAEEGKAIIQTMTPENPVITMAAKQDYLGFYEQEITKRELRGLPPFRDIALINFSGINESQVETIASAFRDRVCAVAQKFQYRISVLGPSPAPIAKVSGKYHFRLTLQLKNDRNIRNMLSGLLSEFSKARDKSAVYISIDMNSYE